MNIDPELERQYNARAAVPDYVDIQNDWKRRSEALRARHPCKLDLAYAESERSRLDLFIAETLGGPLLVYLHGGYWQRGDRRDYHFVAEALCTHEVNVALVGYDLCPAVSIDAIVAQLRTALAWLWRHADNLGFDADRIQVCGHSAGGHLTAALMTTHWPDAGTGLPAGLVHSGLAISGLYELEPLTHTSINAALGMTVEDARRASPALVARTGHAPLTAAVGGLESSEFHRQAQALCEWWPGTRVLEVPDANHFTILESLARNDGALLERALELLARR